MALIGTSIKSKLTGNNGIITGIDKKNLSVTFTYGGNINVPLLKYDELFIMPDRAREEIRTFIDSFKRKKKTES